MKTVSQQLLEYAFNRVQERASADQKDKKKYGIWCHNLGGLIQTNGLCMAMAFLQSKAENSKEGKQGFKMLIKDLSNIPGLIKVQDKGFFDSLKSINSVEYLINTEKVLEAIVYFKRFAESILAVTKEDAQKDKQIEEGI